jgi:hypothetical protein
VKREAVTMDKEMKERKQQLQEAKVSHYVVQCDNNIIIIIIIISFSALSFKPSNSILIGQTKSLRPEIQYYYES